MEEKTNEAWTLLHELTENTKKIMDYAKEKEPEISRQSFYDVVEYIDNSIRDIIEKCNL